MNNPLRLGISPCPNDTYIFEHWIQTDNLDVTYADVQTLNEAAHTSQFDVIKVSAGLLVNLNWNEWTLLPCGGAMGYGCGPLLLGNVPRFSIDTPTCLPGPDTTAALLFKFWFHKNFPNQTPSLQYQVFDKLYQSLLKNEITQGVVIHEHRFTWKRDGLHRFEDLGDFWEQETKAPIPLGVILARTHLGTSRIQQIQSQIQQSLQQARSRTHLVSDFIRKHAQETEENVMEDHIRLFVTDASMDMGEKGQKALETLLQIARDFR